MEQLYSCQWKKQLGVAESEFNTPLCQSSAQIDPEKYPEQKRPIMVDPGQKLSPADNSVNFSPPSGVINRFRIDFSIENCNILVQIWSIQWRLSECFPCIRMTDTGVF